MSCNTCKPTMVIETHCTPRPTATQQCGCKPEVEPVCASYSDVRKMVTNWLYDLDSSVGFGKTLENFVKKSIMTGIQSNDETMLDLKNTIRDALLQSIKAETDAYTDSKLSTKFAEISSGLKVQQSEISAELSAVATSKKQDLLDAVETGLNKAKADITAIVQKNVMDINATAGEIQAAATSAKSQIDTKIENAIDRITNKVDLLGQQLDFKVSQGLQDLKHLKDDAVNDLELLISQAKQDLATERLALESYKNNINAKLAELEALMARVKTHSADVEITDGVGESLHSYAHSEATRS